LFHLLPSILRARRPEIALLSPTPDAGASMSMARLWRDQGERQQAGDLLAPVYGWFT
jgi:hypothetical protein